MLNSLKERAITTAIKALDRAEELATGEEGSSLPEEEARAFEEALRREMREEVALQREAFEARVAELEAQKAGGDEEAICAVLREAAEALGVSSTTPSSALELAGEIAAAARREPRAVESSEVATLRAQFEAARRAHDLECARLREEVAEARKVSGAKTREAEEREGARREGRAAADAACGAAIRSAVAAERERDEAARRDETSRRALRDARYQADEARAAAKFEARNVASLEAEVALAKKDRERAETARANLERVVRSFEAGKSAELAALSRKSGDERDALQNQLDAQKHRLDDEIDRRHKAEHRATDLEVQVVKAVAEARAARAAATAACQLATRKHPPARRRPKTQSTEEEAEDTSQRRHSPGLATLFLDFVDKELGDR